MHRAFAALVVSLSLAAPAVSSAAPSWVVRGAGYGHGVGMSAYGAYGFARNGFEYRRILRHYYRRIRIEQEPAQQVRVLVASGSPVRFRGVRRACGRTLSRSRVYGADRTGRTVRLLGPNGRSLARCGPRLRAEGAPTVELRGSATYRGSLLVIPNGAGTLDVVNRLGLEDYVRGVLPGEVPASWPREALKAMAVAMRSIALSTDVGGDGYELYADTRTQVYAGASAETARTDAAARATAGQVVTYAHRVVQATYFSSSGGRTESAFLGAPQAPYLQSVDDPYDYYSPLHTWTLRFSQAEMDARLGGYVEGRLRRIRVTQRGDTPRIVQARLVGTRGTTTVDGDTLRFALGLYDRWAFFTKVR